MHMHLPTWGVMEELAGWATSRGSSAELCFSATLAPPPNNGQGLIIWDFLMSCMFRPTLSVLSCRGEAMRFCLHLCPERINKAILVCSEVKYTNLGCCGGNFNHYLLMFRPVKSIMSILCSDKRYCRETPCHYFLVAVGVFLQQNIVCSE